MVQVKTALLNGETDSTAGQNVEGYNVPVASLDLEEKDTYTVIITHRKPSSEAEKDTVNLDGFRVYGILDGDTDVYVQDMEDNPTFIEIRDQVLAGLSVTSDGTDQVNAALPTDTTVTVVASSDKYTQTNVDDLLKNGPKNEIYLQPKQTLVFKITTDREVQIGLRALNAATTYTVTKDGEQTISSGTDMFYTLLNRAENRGEQTITITNTGAGILAITKLKICDDPNATLGTLTDEDLADALIALGIIEAPSEPEVSYADAILNITLNDESGAALAETALTTNGVVGEKATFAAADIEAAAAGLVPEGYELTDASYSDVDVAYGDEDEVVFKASVKETENETEEETEPAEEPEHPSNISDKIGTSIKDFFKGLFGK